ncbi:multidrug transporter subunit MdtN [Dyella sp. BiH032]|uniref:multidrug transporter subunit MdtN n=1 Tax=Dyella sp. BiH032 TaxID=3075430 RepID=UPI002892ACDC|nr:multidrug transporter subunit MdtN [Dyella sp. BiH032]WNL46469.1 multidrug transporter subunit MdtN [Dyella sp. BiH032]
MTMRKGGVRRHGRLGRGIVAVVVLAAIAMAISMGYRRARLPATDDATIDADIVHVAAAVGGRIVDIPVAENDQVAQGQLLFQIDPEPYRLAVAQAQAELELAQATLETQRRVLSTQRSAADIAREQTRRAATHLQLADRTVERMRPLTASGYLPVQQFDQAQTTRHDAATSLSQAQEQQAAAERAIDTEAGALAAVHARQAALAIAQRALADTTVRAPRAGRVVGLTVTPGEMVLPSQSLFTLVVTDEWFAVANFREYDLDAIQVGDCATVYSMIDRSRPIRAVVQGLGAGVLDQERINLPRGVPYVERSVNWVRVAQRFPVRVALHDPPASLMRLGASAVVEVKRGAACR